MKVLVAEDDLMLADCLADALLDDGHEVCGIAATVAEAVALARLHRPDIAILDMLLRGGERGSDIADQLAASGDLGRTGILYVTGEAPGGQREARVGHAWLSKPYSLQTLTAAIEIVEQLAIDGRTSRSPPRGMQLLRHPLDALGHTAA